MESFFNSILHMQAPFNMVVFVVLIGSVAGVIKIAATEIRKFGCHRQDIEFKREMVDRGLSAEEIERILAASSRAPSEGPTHVNIGGYVGGTKSDHS